MLSQARKDSMPFAVGEPKERKPGILIVDDEVTVLAALQAEFNSLGFNVGVTVGGNRVIELYRKYQDCIDVVLLAVDMADLDGPGMLDDLLRINSDILACFMTGGPDPYEKEELLDRGAAGVFAKPFGAAEAAEFLELLIRESVLPLRSVFAWQDFR